MTTESLETGTQLAVDLTAPRETFAVVGEELVHTLDIGKIQINASVPVDSVHVDEHDVKGSWWAAYLRGVKPTPDSPVEGVLHTVDLFSGPGGLAQGVGQVAAELGVKVVAEFAADIDAEATLVYAANHGVRRRTDRSVKSLLDYQIREASGGAHFLYAPELTDPELAASLSKVDLVMAGPPCQGHSNLNNHSRRDDPRNNLYLTVPAFAAAVGAPMCIIENVPGVMNDYGDVVTIARQLLQSEGYHVEDGVLSAAAMGWPQTRKRHFMVARRDARPLKLSDVQAALEEVTPRSVWWAIGDLADIESTALIDQPTELSDENQQRVDWLFDNDEYDLALAERPKSHQGGTTYTAVYGRMKKDFPAQTITTGFMSPGRGRYVHPTERRPITAHEAARLQGFPDTYQFHIDPNNPPARAQLAKWIGDAVPMPLGYAAALSVLGGGLPER